MASVDHPDAEVLYDAPAGGGAAEAKAVLMSS